MDMERADVLDCRDDTGLRMGMMWKILLVSHAFTLLRIECRSTRC